MSENELKMLQLIRRNPKSTKSDLASKAQMPWSSAYAIIGKLGEKIIGDGNGEKSESSAYKAGIYINKNYEYYIGISVGSSQLKIVLMAFDFSIVSLDCHDIEKINSIQDFNCKMNALGFKNKDSNKCQWCLDTPDKTESLCDILITICNHICILKDSGVKVRAINFVFPGYVDYYNQRIISTCNLCSDTNSFRGVNISRLITSSLYERLLQKEIQVYIDHNVKSSAVAEKESRFIVSSNVDDLLVVYLGRGVGSSMIINSRLYRDKDSIAGELGEVRVLSRHETGQVWMKLEEAIQNNVFDGVDGNPTAYQLRTYLENNESSRILLVHILAQALSNLIHVIGIKDIVFSGKFDEILNCVEFDLTNELEKFGIYGIHLYHSTYGEYSAAVGAAMGCFYNLYNLDYSWK